MGSFNTAELKKKSAKTKRSVRKRTKRDQKKNLRHLHMYLRTLVAPKAATAAQTGIAKLSDSRGWYLVITDLRHQKSSPKRRFLPEKSLLYTCSAAAILLLQHSLNLVPVLLALKCTDLRSYSSSSANLRRTRHMAFSNSNSTDKRQTVCLSRRFVRPLVWKRPFQYYTTAFA